MFGFLTRFTAMAQIPRTLEISSFDAYLSECSNPVEYALSDQESRMERIQRFPFAVMLKVSYPELDFANRWCWGRFGPCDGMCAQSASEYRACFDDSSHTRRLVTILVSTSGTLQVVKTEIFSSRRLTK
jgi:hypothetical protein